jgi:hypothetical protein
MSESVRHVDPTVALSRAHAAIDELLGLDLTGLGDEAMLEFWRQLERLRRRIPAVEHGLVLEAEARGLPDTLPDAAQAEHGRQIERDLVGYCAQFDPHVLAKLGERIVAYYDPDGPAEAVEHREKHRDVTVHQRVDGSSRAVCEFTAEATELLLLHCDALAKPKPEVDGVKDPRTAGQRRHDALLEALKLNVRAQQLPTVAGVTATIVMTMRRTIRHPSGPGSHRPRRPHPRPGSVPHGGG